MRVVLVLATALAMAGCGSSPKKWEEAIRLAWAAWQKDDFSKAHDLCMHAFELALQVSQGTKAVLALECVAESAERLGKPAKSLPAYETAFRSLEPDLILYPGALRLRNNYAIALAAAGKKDESLVALETALDAYEGTSKHSSNNYRVRMFVVTNIARAVRDAPDSPLGIRVSSEIADEIVRHLQVARFKQTPDRLLGTSDALTAIAEIVRVRGDPKLADELRAQAIEVRGIEDDILDGKSRRLPCDKLVMDAMVIPACHRELRERDRL